MDGIAVVRRSGWGLDGQRPTKRSIDLISGRVGGFVAPRGSGYRLGQLQCSTRATLKVVVAWSLSPDWRWGRGSRPGKWTGKKSVSAIQGRTSQVRSVSDKGWWRS